MESGSQIYTNYTASITVFQPLLIYNEGHEMEGQSVDLTSENDENSYNMLLNPSYKRILKVLMRN